MNGRNPALAKFVPDHGFKIGDVVIASRCGRADNVHYVRYNVTGVIERDMGAGLAFRGGDGALFFADHKDITRVA